VQESDVDEEPEIQPQIEAAAPAAVSLADKSPGKRSRDTHSYLY